MNIWLLKIGEAMPINKEQTRLYRMGMIAEELSNRGHNIIWFSSTFDHDKKEQLFNEDTNIKIKNNYSIYMIHGIKYKKNISITRIINHKMVAQKFKRIAKTLDKPDLIYVSFPIIDLAEEAIKYGKQNNIPVIVDIRDLWPDIFNHNLSKPLRIIAWPYIKYMNYKTKKIMNQAFAINAISEAILEWGLNKGNREKNKYDRYFYIGYDKNNNEQKDQENLKILDIIDNSKFNISFFATINNQFDYEKIITLARKIEEKDKDIIINICGDGPQMSILKKETENVSNVKLLGWKDQKELIYILQNSKIGLAPYKNTFDFQMSVSNKFAEYISYGLPIILTSEGYMKKLIEKYKCGLSSQDMNEMSNFIIDLKNNPEKYKESSTNALQLYKEKFIAKEIYKELVNYLEEIKEEI